jgi:hypothetical protein
MCTVCHDEAVQFRRESLMATSQTNRVCNLYHEGFTLNQIVEVTGYHPLLVAYIIEDYA